MQICFFCENFDMGGIQNVNYILGKEFIKNGHDVKFYSFLPNKNYYDIPIDILYPTKRKIYENIYIHKLIKLPRIGEQLLKKGSYTPNKYVKRSINRFVEFINDNKINLVILSGGYLTSLIPKIKEKVNFEVKFIAWQHNNFVTYIDNYYKRFQSEFLSGLSAADAVVCLTKSDLSKFRAFNSQTKCIYNPVTISNFSKIANLNSKLICFVGRIDIEHKGIDILLKIAKKLPDSWKISIAGQGDKKSMAEFNRLIKKNNVESKIIFKGSLNGEALANHFAECSFYLMTSRWEGMPLVLIEAMSFGLPIISLEQSGANEVLQDGYYGAIVNKNNLNDLEKKINEFIISYGIRKEYGQKSIERVKDFSIDKIYESWNVLIQNI